MKNTKFFGTKEKPRISIFRSNRYIYAQAVEDENKNTICSFSSLNFSAEEKTKKITKRDQAKLIGVRLAEKLKKTNIKSAVFDKGRNKYHGRVAALAEGLREGGIKI